MSNKLQFDTERWLRSNAELYRRKGSQQMARNFELCAEDFKRLKMADDLNQQVTARR